MYALIKGGGNLIGIFDDLEIMKIVIQGLIKSYYEKNGVHGCYHFQYAVFNPNEPWLYEDENQKMDINGKAILSLWTMHSEYFTHKVKTDWSTGEVLDMDADSCSNK